MGVGTALMPWRRPSAEVERVDPSLTVDQYIEMLQAFQFQGVQYTYPTATQEEIGGTYASLARSAYKGNGIVFACMLVRMLLFSEARFQFRQLRGGRPGDLFGNADLGILESPWPGATTGDMLSRMIQYADLAGNAFAVRRGPRIRLLRPDWVTMILGTNDPDSTAWDVDADVVGYSYQPGGPGSGRPLNYFLADEVAHFAPIPDPEARYRGMSWLTPIIREIMGDKAMTDHKLRVVENGASRNLVVKLDVPDLEDFRAWIEEFRKARRDPSRRYEALFFGAGADVTTVGLSMQELEFKITQGAGETRIAAAAGVPPIIAGFSEGLAAATYSNYGQARRRFADGTMRPLWRNVSGSLARIITVPASSELWYDDRDIAFLQEDQKDKADILQADMVTIETGVRAGFKPESVVSAVAARDVNLLEHSGLVSVQLQEPGAEPNGNGSSNGKPALAGANTTRKLLDALTPQED